MMCWYYRWRFQSNLDHQNADSLPEHMQQCPACRQYARQIRRLHEQLRQSPSDAACDLQLERIQTAVLDKLSQAAAPTRIAIRRPAPLLAAAASVLLLLGLWGLLRTPNRPVPLTTPSFSMEAIQLPLAQLARLSENPLETELQYLAADTRQALAHLQNCLPGSPTPLEHQSD